jgi:hypothetical protein
MKLIAKVMTVGLLAGAFVMAAPTKAEAQGFGVAVQVGYPHYDYARHDYYDHMRFEQERRAEFERQEAFRRHEEWMRERDFHRDRDWRFHDRDDHRGYGWR